MQTSDNTGKRRRVSAFRICVSLYITAAISIWLAQGSINNYWRDNYHCDSPLVLLERFAVWGEGAAIHDSVETEYADSKDYLSKIYDEYNVEYVAAAGEFFEAGILQNGEDISQKSSSETTRVSLGNNGETAKKAANYDWTENDDNRKEMQTASSDKNDSDTVVLGSNDEVFFGGDSLMEGVAPHVSVWLKAKGIKSKDRSRRSTGLSYPNPKVRDWPLEIENTLKSNPNIKLVVMFLGPNDPWDFPNPDNLRGKYLSFRSEAWESVYRSRISRILDAAAIHKAKVIWLGIPYMKKEKLNSQTAYIDQVLFTETAGRALFLPTKNLLSDSNSYSDSISIDGKYVTVRSKDGIHFTRKGQEILARAIKEKIAIRLTKDKNEKQENVQ